MKADFKACGIFPLDSEGILKKITNEELLKEKRSIETTTPILEKKNLKIAPGKGVTVDIFKEDSAKESIEETNLDGEISGEDDEPEQGPTNIENIACQNMDSYSQDNININTFLLLRLATKV